MCGIFGSKSIPTFNVLGEANTIRGKFSHSIAFINPQTYQADLNQTFGQFQAISHAPQNAYLIGHVQAPTGGRIKDFSRIHPAQLDHNGFRYMLYHNGVLLPSFVPPEYGWDTLYLLKFILENGTEAANFADALSLVKGAFSCILIKSGEYIRLFRNENAPMHIGDNLNFSSVSTEGVATRETEPLVIYSLDFEKQSIYPISKFENADITYSFKEGA
jgi:hypothetical protein